MKPDPLLDAVFNPGEESLRPALKTARRRRVRRMILRASSIAACVVVVVGLAMPGAVSRFAAGIAGLHSPAPAHRAPPQPGNQQLATRNFPRIETISTRPITARDLVHTKGDSVLVISTASASSTPAKLADSELLAFFEPGRAALIGSGAERRLVRY